MSSVSTMTVDIGRGFAQPVHHGQQVFRSVLQAMAYPGRVQTLSADVFEGFDSAGLGRGLGAVLLALLDGETSLWLAPALAGESAAAHLRFHTGVRLVVNPAQAAFVACHAGAADTSLWAQLNAGSDTSPQVGATLLIEVESLEHGSALSLRGPGIEQVQSLRVAGLSDAFWRARVEAEADFPCGIDLILCCGERLAALPRSTHVSLEG